MYGVIRSHSRVSDKKKIARGSPDFSKVLIAPILTRMIDTQYIPLRSCEWIDMRGKRVIGKDRSDGLGGFG